MKHFAVIIGIILNINAIQATDYYLSSTGNDSNSGTSQNQAWASLKKLNGAIFSLAPGDRVLFERGNRFEGTINIQNIIGSEANPVIFGAYGSGENPVIEGTGEVDGWTREGDIWTANCPECPNEIYTLFINGESQPLGRYPNEAYLKTSSGSGKNILHDSDLSFADNYWQGAQVVIRTQSWVRDAVRVSSQIGTTIILSDRTTYDIAGNTDYFFQNHYNALDSEGEWAYDNTNRKIYIYSTRDIQNSRVSIALHNECISVRNGRYIHIEDLMLQGSRLISLRIDNSKHINFSNSTINNSAGLAIRIDHCENIMVDNNDIANSLNMAIGCWDSNQCRFTNNRIEDTGTIPGRGKNGNAGYTGIYISRGSDNVFEYNEVIQTGYNAISFSSQSNLLVKNNYINGYCTVNTDGGGIYTWHSSSTGNRILGNIVLNSRFDIGIYIDDESENIEIEGNTTAFNMSGIFIHNSRYIKVFNNLCFNNHESQFIMVTHGKTLVDYNEIMNNHIFTMGKPKQYSLRARFVMGEHNVFENNCWADPFKKKLINSESSVWKTKVYSVPEWQSLGFPTDRSIPYTFAESGLPDTTGFVKFFVNPSKSIKTVDLAGSYRDLDNHVYVGTVELEPYTSIVLLAEERDK